MIKGIDHPLGQRLWHFPGGVRLRHFKKMSISESIAEAPLPQRLTLPLNQSSGVAPPLAVEAGQQIARFQRLTAPFEGLGAHLHAPTSGTVLSVEEGAGGACLVLQADGRDEGEPMAPLLPWRKQSPEALRGRLLDAGVVGLGGALFPTHFKLEQPERVQVLIINGAECEPYISCDEMIMRCWPGALLEGTRILARVVGAEQVLIAIEDQMGEVEAILNRAVGELACPEVRIVKVPTIYPEGGENQLIQVLTGLEVPSGGIPRDIGIVMQNVATAVACRDAVQDGRPLVSRVVTVTGHGIESPANFHALIGTPISELVALAGGYRSRARRLIVGGPMMGRALADDRQPTTKGSNCVLALTDSDIRPPAPQLPCIRCGECQRVCPAQLMPQLLMGSLENGDLDGAKRLNLRDCIECGCCAYVCPSQIPLVDYYRHGKHALALKDQREREAQAARARFAAHEARLAVLAEQRERALARRQEKLAELDPGQALADILARRRTAAADSEAGPGDDTDGNPES